MTVRRISRACCLVLAALIVLPAAASAAGSVSVTTSADPTEDVTYQVTVSGSTDQEEEILATIKPAGGTPCAASYAADDGNDILDDFVTGAYSDVINRTTSDSGSYLICAWVEDSADDASAWASDSHPFTVRVPHASGSVTAPAVVKARSTFQLSMTVQTEVEREVLVAVNPAGIPCAANYAADDGEGAFDEDNTGGPTTYTTNWDAPNSAGTYLVCGYVQESSDDTVPEARFQGAFTVPPPPSPACRDARSRVRNQTQAAARSHHAWKHYAKKARHAHGHRRHRYKQRAAKAHHAYKTALRRLERAQSDVDTNC